MMFPIGVGTVHLLPSQYTWYLYGRVPGTVPGTCTVLYLVPGTEYSTWYSTVPGTVYLVRTVPGTVLYLAE
jgi:hypothetical protein